MLKKKKFIFVLFNCYRKQKKKLFLAQKMRLTENKEKILVTSLHKTLFLTMKVLMYFLNT